MHDSAQRSVIKGRGTKSEVLLPREKKPPKITKSVLVERVHSNAELPSKVAAELVDMVFDIMRRGLKRDRRLKISKFGAFLVREKKARRGRNPQMGVPLIIAPRKSPTFKPSAALKARLNRVPVRQ